jgi:hypothetical protein
MTEPSGTYPHHLMGAPAAPPTAPGARILRLAREARSRQLAEEGLEAQRELGFTMPNWRLAKAVTGLRDEANQANPARDKSSDGTIGDSRHAGGGPGTPEWDDSDHNPWLTVAGLGVVRALDIDTDGLDLAAAFERGRQLAAAGKLPQVTGGGYFIVFGRITAPDFNGWHAYKGTDPHVTHGHVSMSTAPARFDSTAPWGIFGAVPAPAPAPAPVPASGTDWTGPDLTGRGPTLRGQAAGQPQGPQSNGQRTAELQGFLNRYAPAYSKLNVDGWYGTATGGVLAEFARRSGIKGADGLNIGPQLAAALYRAGFDRSAAAQRLTIARATRHLVLGGRR